MKKKNKKINNRKKLIALPIIGIAPIALSSTTFFNRQQEKNELTDLQKILNKISIGDQVNLTIYDTEILATSAPLENGKLSFIIPDSNSETNNYLDGVTLTYEHGEIINDGLIPVKVFVRRGEEVFSKTFEVNIVGLNQSIIDNLKPKFSDTSYTIQSQEILEIEKAENLKTNENSYLGISIPSNLYNAEVSFSHDAITSDGDSKVTVHIKSGDIEEDIVLNVDVNGINAARINSIIKHINDFDNTDFFVDSDQTIVEEISKVTSFDVIRSDLGIDLSKINSYGANINYEHAELTSDGILQVKFTINLGSETVEHFINMNVKGINAARIAAIKQSLAALEPIEYIAQMGETTIDEVTAGTSFDTAVKYLNMDLSGIETYGANISYEHIAINADGNLEVKFTIGLEGQTDTQIVNVNVKGLNDNKDLDIVTNLFNEINGKTFDHVTNETIIETITEQSKTAPYLGINLDNLNTNQDGVSYLYSHGQITKDGSLEVKIQITKGTQVKEATVNVNVTGIIAARIAAIKQSIAALEPIEYIALMGETTIDEVTAGTSFDTAVKYLNMDLSGIETYGANISYEHIAINADGNLEVKFTIGLEGQTDTQIVNVNVKGLNDNKDLDIVTNLFNEINGKTFDHVTNETIIETITEQSKTAPYLGINLDNLNTNQDGVSYLYSHGQITKDGSLEVKIQITKGTQVKEATVNVNVTGIIAARIAAIKQSIAALEPIEYIALMGETTIDEVTAGTSFDTAVKYLNMDLSGIETYGANISYEHIAINADGNLEVKFTIGLEGQTDTQIVNVNVKGLNDNKDLDIVTNLFNEINGKTFDHVTNETIIETITEQSKTAPYLGINLDNLNTNQDGVSYLYSHGQITKDGSLEVKIQITKGTQVKEATVNVNVTGIIAARIAAIKQSIAALEPIEYIALMGETTIDEVTAGTSFDTAVKYLNMDLSGIETYGANISYEHIAINADGNLEVKFTIGLEGQTDTQIVNVNVKGLNDNKDLDIVTNLFNEINGKTFNHVTNETIIETITEQSKTAPYLGINLDNLNTNQDGVSYLYSHGQITKDGSLEVKIQITKGTQVKEATVNVNVTGIIAARIAAIKQSLAALEPIEYIALMGETTIDEVTAGTSFDTAVKYLNMDLSGIETYGANISYEHIAINADGNLEVKFTIGLEGQTDTQIVNVNVKGLNDNKDLDIVTNLFNEINGKTFNHVTNETIIETITEQSKTAPYLGINLDNLNTNQDGVSYLYSHGQITKDGSLEVKIQITKGTQVKEATVNVNVTGIIAARIAAIKQSLAALEPIEYIALMGETTIDEVTAGTSFDTAVKYLNMDLSGIETYGANISYEHIAINADGNLEVKFTIGLEGQTDTQIVNVNVKGLNDNKDLDIVTNLFNEINGKTFNHVTNETIIETITEQSKTAPYLGINLDNLNTNQDGVSYLYSHGQITKDGSLEVKIQITKGTQVKEATVNVNVTGIIAARIAAIKQSLAALEPIEYIALMGETTIDEVTAGTSFDTAVKYLNMDLSGIETYGANISYEHIAINADGNLEVKFTIGLEGQTDTQIVNVNVKGLNDNKDLDIVTNLFNEINGKTFNHVTNETIIETITEQSKTAPYLGINLDNLNTNQDGVSYLYSHGQITKDGSLEVKIQITKGTQVKEATVNVNVTGIIAARIAAIKQSIAALEPIEYIALMGETTIDEVTAGTSFDTAVKYLNMDLSGIETYGANISYEHIAINADGNLEVKFTIGLEGQTDTQIVNVNVKGLNDNKDLDIVTNLFNEINGKTFNHVTNETIIETITEQSKTAPYLGINLDNLNTNQDGVSYLYSHGQITKDGSLEVKIQITKGTQVKEATVNVNVTGIIAARIAAIKQSLAALEPIEYIALMGETTIDEVTSGTSFDTAVKYLNMDLSGIETYGANISYEHIAINADGNLEVKFTIGLEGQTDTQIVNVNVKGLNDNKDLDIVTNLFNEINGKTFNHVTNETIIETITEQSKTAPYLGINLDNLNTNQDGVSYLYSHGQITKDGSLEVKIQITKGTQVKEATVNVNVTGIIAARIAAIKQSLAALEPIEYIALMGETTIDEVTSGTSFDTAVKYLNMDLSGIETYGANISYEHIAINADGNLEVKFTIGLEGQTDTQIVNVNVKGLNDNKDLDIVTNLFNEINGKTFNHVTNETIIETITEQSKTAPYLGINLDNLNTNQDGVSYLYSHGQITKDGSLEVKIQITKGTQVKEATVNVNVTGIIAARIAAIKQSLAALEPIEYIALMGETTIDEVTSGTSFDTAVKYLNMDLSGIETYGANISYEHIAINADGNLEVKFTIGLEGQTDTQIVNVNVKGLNDNKDLDIVTNLFNEINGKTFNHVTNETIIETITEQSKTAPYLGINLDNLNTNQDGVSYLYSHGQITKDGSLEVKIQITKGTQVKEATVNVNVTGIIAARIAAIKQSIAALEPIEYIALMGETTIDEVTAGTSFDTAVKYLNMDLSGIETYGANISYEHIAINADGNLEVKFTIGLEGQTDTQIVNVNVKGLNDNKDLDIVTNLFNEINGKTFNHVTNETIIETITEQSKTAPYLGINLDNLNTNQDGVSYLYSHGQITKDGSLEVKIQITKGTQVKEATVNVNVTGIIAARIAAIKQSLAALEPIEYIAQTGETTIDEVTSGTSFDTAVKYLNMDLSGIETYGANISYEHIAINADGNLEVKFTIGLEGQTDTQIVNVNVKGLNDNKDLDIVTNLFNEINGKTFNHVTNETIIETITEQSKTAPYLGINLDNLNTNQDGVSYLYSHGQITKDGSLEVKIQITKGTQVKEATVNVNVTGIIAARIAAIKQSLAALEPIEYIAQMGETTIDEVTSGTSFDTAVKYLNMDLSGIETYGANISYEHIAINADGNLEVKFTIGLEGQTDTQIVNVNVKGLNDNKDFDIVTNLFNEINGKTFDHVTNETIIETITEQSKTAPYLGINLDNLNTNQDGVSYLYSHGQITKDGSLEVKIQITKGTQVKEATVNVNVTGINDARAAAIIAIKQSIAALEPIEYIAQTGETTIAEVTAGTSFDTAVKYLNIDLSGIETYGANISYEHIAINANGNLEVKFTIDLDGQTDTQIVNVNVKGLDLQMALSQFQDTTYLINGGPNSFTNGLQEVVNSVFNNNSMQNGSLELTYNSVGIEGVSITYSHEAIVSDGQIAPITFFATKDGITLEKTINATFVFQKTLQSYSFKIDSQYWNISQKWNQILLSDSNKMGNTRFTYDGISTYYNTIIQSSPLSTLNNFVVKVEVINRIVSRNPNTAFIRTWFHSGSRSDFSSSFGPIGDVLGTIESNYVSALGENITVSYDIKVTESSVPSQSPSSATSDFIPLKIWNI